MLENLIKERMFWMLVSDLQKYFNFVILFIFCFGCLSFLLLWSFLSTVKPRYSAVQGTGQNCALNRGFHYCQFVNNYENTSWDQNLYALLAEIHYKRVRYSGVLLYQVFSSLLGQHFFFTFMEQLFNNHPIFSYFHIAQQNYNSTYTIIGMVKFH